MSVVTTRGNGFFEILGGEKGTTQASVYEYSNSPRARARFVAARKQAKAFIVKKRGYRCPDFNRIILDLRNLGWSHEKIAHVLDVSSASTVSAWSTGTKPFYENGEQLIMLWQEQTGIERYPREDEWLTYKYKVGQLDLLNILDGVIEQLDDALAMPKINHNEYKHGDLVMYTVGQPVLLRVHKNHDIVLVSKFGSSMPPNAPSAQIRKATKKEIVYAIRKWREEEIRK